MPRIVSPSWPATDRPHHIAIDSAHIPIVGDLVGQWRWQRRCMSETVIEHRNEVVLVGRITSPASERVLPSGDTITSWRITVDRDGEGRDVVEISGAIRRRFWRAGAGLGSATEVEVQTAKRVSPAATRPRKRG